MFDFRLSETLQKKMQKLHKKDPMLARAFKRKLEEIVAHDERTIDTYKNLKSPLNEFKRIHLTDNFIILFKVYKQDNFIHITDICHWDKAYT